MFGSCQRHEKSSNPKAWRHGQTGMEGDFPHSVHRDAAARAMRTIVQADGGEGRRRRVQEMRKGSGNSQISLQEEPEPRDTLLGSQLVFSIQQQLLNTGHVAWQPGASSHGLT